MAITVTSPDGQRWGVRRRWLPRLEGRGLRARWRQAQARRRRRAEDGDVRWWDWVPDFFGLDDGPAVWLVIVLVFLALVLLVIFGIPLLLALLDLVVVLVLLVVGVVGRVLFRRPWLVEAESDAGDRVERRVVGLRASGRMRHELAGELEHGRR